MEDARATHVHVDRVERNVPLLVDAKDAWIVLIKNPLTKFFTPAAKTSRPQCFATDPSIDRTINPSTEANAPVVNYQSFLDQIEVTDSATNLVGATNNVSKLTPLKSIKGVLTKDISSTDICKFVVKMKIRCHFLNKNNNKEEICRAIVATVNNPKVKK